jgi:cell division protein FtsB
MSRGIGDALSSALCACIISYCVVSFVAGQAGLLAYRDLKISIARMDRRIEELKSRNQALGQLHADLESNPDRMAREAREIGFLRPGEKILVLPREFSLALDQGKLKEMEIIRGGTSTGLPDTLVKLLAAAIGAAVLAASLAASLFSHPRLKPKTEECRSL